MNFISAKAGVREYVRMSGHKGDLDKSDILAWTNDAVSRIVTDEQLIHKLVLLEVKDYKADLPIDFATLIQASYLISTENISDLKWEVSEFTDRQLGCNINIEVKCPKCKKHKCSCDSPEIYVDVDRLWRSAHPEYQVAYMNHFHNFGRVGETSTYSDKFKLMKPATGSYFNSEYHLKGCVNFNVDTEVEYRIQHPNIIVNFKEGKILLAYLAKRIDEEGYLLVPDEPVAIEAISWYIQEKMLYRRFLEDFSQNTRLAWQQAFELREKFIARANSQLQMPSADVWRTFIRRFVHRILPGRLNAIENEYFRKDPGGDFKYPDQTYNIKD